MNVAASGENPRTRIGLVCLPGLEGAIAAARACLGWVEIEPQVSWLPGQGVDAVLRSGPLSVAREHRLPVLLHSVSAPVGGTTVPPAAQVELLAELVGELQCPFVSEHLSFIRMPDGADGVFTGVLLAPPQTNAAVEVAAANLDYLRQGVGVPVAFETGVNYLAPRAGELSDGAFFRAVAQASGSGILLDLHNLWCNEQNGRQRARDVIAELPLDRIWEIHVAAGYWQDRYYLDAHSGPAEQPVLDLLAEILPKLPNLQAVVFEVSPDRIGRAGLTIDVIVEHLGTLASLVGESAHPLGPGPVRPRIETGSVLPVPTPGARGDVEVWERHLAELVRGQGSAGILAADRGYQVWRNIAEASRRGQLAGALPLTMRLLLQSAGEAAVLEALRQVWARLPPAETCAGEIAQLVPELRARWSDTVPLFNEVLDFELAQLARLANPREREESADNETTTLELCMSMNSGRYPGGDDFVELSEPDKQRMARLYEEVHSRLVEMSLIVARNLGMNISERTTVMLRPINVKANKTTEQAPAGRKVEVHCTETSAGHFECGCYDYEAGTCGPC